MGAHENEDEMLALQEANELRITLTSLTVPIIWKEDKTTFQLDDEVSVMSMEEDLHALKFTEKEMTS